MKSMGSFMVIYVLGLIVFFYLFVILPGKRKNKKVRTMHDSVRAGDVIATIGGIIGTVKERDGETATVLIDEKNGTTIKIVIQAVQSILEKSEA